MRRNGNSHIDATHEHEVEDDEMVTNYYVIFVADVLVVMRQKLNRLYCHLKCRPSFSHSLDDP